MPSSYDHSVTIGLRLSLLETVRDLLSKQSDVRHISEDGKESANRRASSLLAARNRRGYAKVTLWLTRGFAAPSSPQKWLLQGTGFLSGSSGEFLPMALHQILHNKNCSSYDSIDTCETDSYNVGWGVC